MGARAWYATRERVMSASDIKSSAYLAAEIDAAIESASQAVDDLCHRGDAVRPGFAPWTGSITFDWPSAQAGNNSYRLWLGSNLLVSLTSATSGSVSLGTDAFGSPADGPPYSAVEIDRDSNAYLDPGDAVGQRSLVVTGVWGQDVNERTATTWQLGSSPSASATTVTLNAPVGVGSIVRVDSERMIVAERSWVSTGQTATLAASLTTTNVAVADGTAFFRGEEIIIDSERMLILDIVGNTLLVKRGYGGSTLAAHTAATIYWSRSFTVERGALGTTAASHTSGAQLYVYRPPALIEQLTVALAQDQRAQESSGYARTVGTGDAERQAGGGALRALSDRVYARYGRKVRHRAV